MRKTVILETNINEDNTEVVFNMVYLNTGEIAQKRRSMEWLLRRVFYYELKRRKKDYGEEIEYEMERRRSNEGSISKVEP